MKWNEGEMTALLATKPPDWEGRLTYKPPKSSSTFSRETGYKERYFKLVGNLMFCLRVTPEGQGDPAEPVLVLLMENFTVAADQMAELHSFTVTFRGEENHEKRHCFVTDSARSVTQWVEVLKDSSYQQRRERLILLQIKLRNRTGLNPLLGTNLESNPVYSLGSGHDADTRVSPLEASQPPVPAPRTKAKGKASSSGFTSHLGVEYWEDPTLREDVERREENSVGATKSSFTSHVPTGNLVEL